MVFKTEDMRDILFRGKRIDNGEWVYGYYSLFKESHAIMCDDGLWRKVVPESVGQFTGLYDKHNNKVFEGDILHDPGENRWFNWLVKIIDGHTCLINIGVDGYQHAPMYLDQSSARQREIIGDIHTNPNLLNP